jgi:pimeloyl-ACP methyl ester carboxylesterase
LRRRHALVLAAAAACRTSGGWSGAPAGWPGTPGRWRRWLRHDFTWEERPAVVVAPDRPARGGPWLWRGEFFGAYPDVDQALLDLGWHVAYLDCRDTFGSPPTLARFTSFYRRLTGLHRLSPRPVLLGMSRGALYVYRWAAEHPESVGLIHGDAPVCDVKSWPGGKGRGRGSPRDWALFQKVFGLDEAAALAWRGNPIDRLEPLARARLPILHLVGDADDVVPVEENTSVLAARYQALGGHVEVVVKPGVGHHPHGLPDPSPLVKYILERRL